MNDKNNRLDRKDEIISDIMVFVIFLLSLAALVGAVGAIFGGSVVCVWIFCVSIGLLFLIGVVCSFFK